MRKCGAASGGRIFGQFAMQKCGVPNGGPHFWCFGLGKCSGLLWVSAFLCVWYVGVWW
jgi:hypothetical protein